MEKSLSHLKIDEQTSNRVYRLSKRYSPELYSRTLSISYILAAAESFHSPGIPPENYLNTRRIYFSILILQFETEWCGSYMNLLFEEEKRLRNIPIPKNIRDNLCSLYEKVKFELIDHNSLINRIRKINELISGKQA